MPKITIDQHEVRVADGATILDAARKLGIDIPTLCFLEGYKPSTSCLVCVVKIRGTDRLVPACGTAAVEGIEIDSETEEVHNARRTALELLLSDHVGDCLAPCELACPAQLNVPLVLRRIRAESLRQAIATLKQQIAMPAVLGRVCPGPCEKACRRNAADAPVTIRHLNRYTADADLASDDPYLPERKPGSGRRVAIIGAGPTGLAAAYYLRREGHAVTLFDKEPRPGGRLLAIDQQKLPRDVLEAEIHSILRLGVELRTDTKIDNKPSLADLNHRFDAVLIACGATGREQARLFGLQTGSRGIQIDRGTFQTGMSGVFAAGNAVRGTALVVRSVADGKAAAAILDEYLAGRPIHAAEKPFSTRIGRLTPEEMSDLLAGAASGFTPAEATEQAARCLHCDCRGRESCRLRHYAAVYGADPKRFQGPRRTLRLIRHGKVIYEPGKCIDCGLCIEIAAAAGEPLGLTLVGRGFDVRVGPPLDRSLEEALGKAAAQCIAACPTAALARRDSPAWGAEINSSGHPCDDAANG